MGKDHLWARGLVAQRGRAYKKGAGLGGVVCGWGHGEDQLAAVGGGEGVGPERMGRGLWKGGEASALSGKGWGCRARRAGAGLKERGGAGQRGVA